MGPGGLLQILLPGVFLPGRELGAGPAFPITQINKARFWKNQHYGPKPFPREVELFGN